MKNINSGILWVLIVLGCPAFAFAANEALIKGFSAQIEENTAFTSAWKDRLIKVIESKLEKAEEVPSRKAQDGLHDFERLNLFKGYSDPSAFDDSSFGLIELRLGQSLDNYLALPELSEKQRAQDIENSIVFRKALAAWIEQDYYFLPSPLLDTLKQRADERFTKHYNRDVDVYFGGRLFGMTKDGSPQSEDVLTSLRTQNINIQSTMKGKWETLKRYYDPNASLNTSLHPQIQMFLSGLANDLDSFLFSTLENAFFDSSSPIPPSEELIQLGKSTLAIIRDVMEKRMKEVKVNSERASMTAIAQQQLLEPVEKLSMSLDDLPLPPPADLAAVASSPSGTSSLPEPVTSADTQATHEKNIRRWTLVGGGILVMLMGLTGVRYRCR